MNRKRYIYFCTTNNGYIVPPEYNREWEAILSIDIIPVVGWDNLDKALRQDANWIGFHVTEFINKENNLTFNEMIWMVKTRLALYKLEIPIVIGISPDTPQEYIKMLKKENVLGLIPARTLGFDETHIALKAMINNEPYWPKHIIDKLPGAVKKKPKRGQIDLTERQLQILSLIKQRGAPNKVIAKALNLSESTVKLHVGAILKKYGLKNRTQLALFTNDQNL